MAGRRFGQVRQSMFGSKKVRALPDDGCRYAFVYLISCGHGNAVGYYRLPPDYMAADLDTTADEARRRIGEMCKVGLIDYDDDEQLVRVRNWWSDDGQGDIASYKALMGASRAALDIPRGCIFRASVAVELVAAALLKCDEWSTDASKKDSISTRLQIIEQLILRIKTDHPEQLKAAILELKPDRSERFIKYLGEITEL